MNRNALIAAVVFMGLLGVVLFLEFKPDEKDTEAFAISGFLDKPDDAVKTVAELNTSGFEKIEITRKGETLGFELRDGTWKMTAPVEANAEEVKLKSILLPHQKTLNSIYSAKASDDTLSDYGLDGDNAIEVKITKEGALFAHYLVGDSTRSDEPGAGADETDTWIREPGSDRIYRLAGADLRRAVDVTMSDLRSKKFFELTKDAIRSIELINPEDQGVAKVIIVNETPAAADKADPDGEDAKSPEAKWVIQEPSGYIAGSGINTLANSIAGLRASEFLRSTEGLDTGLGGATLTSVQVAFRDGSEHTLVLGNTVEDDTFASFEGSEEVFKLSKFTANALKKTLNELRNKKVLGIDRTKVTSIQMPAVTLAKTGEDWGFTNPPGLQVDKDGMSGLLRDLENFSVTDFADASQPQTLGLGEGSDIQRTTIAHGGKTSVLAIGPAVDDVHYGYLDTGAAPKEVWKLTAYMAKKFRDKTATDFRNRKVFAFTRDDVQSVTLKSGGETIVIKRAGEENVYAVEVDGAPLPAADAPVVSTVVSTLANLKAKSFSGAMLPADAGLSAGAFTAETVLKDGTTHTLVISDKSEEENNYALAPSESEWGQQVFTLNKYQAKNIMKSGTDLAKK